MNWKTPATDASALVSDIDRFRTRNLSSAALPGGGLTVWGRACNPSRNVSPRYLHANLRDIPQSRQTAKILAETRNFLQRIPA
jgi:hypothetical protein